MGPAPAKVSWGILRGCLVNVLRRPWRASWVVLSASCGRNENRGSGRNWHPKKKCSDKSENSRPRGTQNDVFHGICVWGTSWVVLKMHLVGVMKTNIKTSQNKRTTAQLEEYAQLMTEVESPESLKAYEEKLKK